MGLKLNLDCRNICCRQVITIKKKTTRVDSNPDPDLKPHHEISYDPKYLIPIDKEINLHGF